MLSNKSSKKSIVKADEMPELLGLQETCDLLKVHPNTLRQWDRKGVLVALRFGVRKDRKYRKEDILKLIGHKYEK